MHRSKTTSAFEWDGQHPNIVPSSLGIWIAIEHVVLWVHLSQPPNGISIGLAGLTNVTNRHTDRQTTLLRLKQ